MEQGLRSRTYLGNLHSRRSITSVLLAFIGLAIVGWIVVQTSSLSQLLDTRSVLIVVLGTLVTTLMQFDLPTLFYTFVAVLRSFWQAFDTRTDLLMRELDAAIAENRSLLSLRAGDKINGDLLNDIVYMYRQGLIFDEIDQFVTSKIEVEHTRRRIAVSVLRRAAITAPSLGLLGTVLGLTGVLRAMGEPGEIGALMSLALMTTAYGAGLSSLVLTPLAGRLEHHNTLYVSFYKQILSRLGILLTREERDFSSTHLPQSLKDKG